MISVYDEFAQLKEVILGDVNIGLTKHLKSHEKTLVEEILLETKENLNVFRERVYNETRKIHVSRFPYNHFLYPKGLD